MLYLEPEGPPTPLTGISFAGHDIGSAQLNFHNETVYEKTGKFNSQILEIDW